MNQEWQKLDSDWYFAEWKQTEISMHSKSESKFEAHSFYFQFYTAT